MKADTHTDGHTMLFLFSEALSRCLRVFRLLFRHYSCSETHGVTQDAFTDESVEITKKMQPCNRIYYSKIY